MGNSWAIERTVCRGGRALERLFVRRFSLKARFQELFTDAFHAFYGRMSVLLLNVMEFDQFYLVMRADFANRLVDGVSQLRVQDTTDGCRGIPFVEQVEEAGKGRPEILAVLFCPVSVLVLTDGRVCPCIVGTTEDEDDIRVAKAVHPSDEVAARGIHTTISSTTDGSATPGIVLLQSVAFGLDVEVPPSLFHLFDIIFVIGIERRVIVRDDTDESGVRVTKNGHSL